MRSPLWLAALAFALAAPVASAQHGHGGHTGHGAPVSAPAPPPVHAPPGASQLAADRPGTSAADVRFMQGMIGHHAQAVEMTALVADRAESEDIRMLARRIEASQADEIALMERWLTRRGQAVPQTGAHGAGHGGMDHGSTAHGTDHAAMGHEAPGHDAHAGMPGMLTAAQMARLAASRGADFDRLFLESMIYHHEGALTMVEELLTHTGAAQDPETFHFVSHVDSDQRVEILRMRRMLGALTQPQTP